MTNCLAALKGIAFDCAVNLAGVDRIYLANYDELKFELEAEDTTGIVTKGTLKASAKLGEYVPAKNTGSLTKTMTKNESTGVRYWNNEIVAQFNSMKADKRAELDSLDGAPVAGLVKDKNGVYWVIGFEQYATVTAATGQTGAAPDDGNFYSITITDVTGARMRTMEKTAAETLIKSAKGTEGADGA